MKSSLLDVHNMGRRAAQALQVRQDPNDMLCFQQCITDVAPAVLDSCGTDLACMCGDRGYKGHTLTCMDQQCPGYDRTYMESLLNVAFNSCAGGSDPFGTDGGVNLPTQTSSRPQNSTPRPSQTYTSSPSDNTDDPAPSPNNSGDGGVPIGAVVGGAVGGVVVLALLGILIWWLVRRSKNRDGNKPNAPNAGYGGLNTPASEIKPPSLSTTAAPAFVGGFSAQGQPPQGPMSPMATSMYTNTTVSPPSSELGYVPPQNFAMFGQPQSVSHGFPTAPSSSSGGTSVVGDLPSFNSYAPSAAGQSSSSSQPSRPLQLHTAAAEPHAGTTQQQQWPQDVKRPLNVMTNEVPDQPEQYEAPPPSYQLQQ